MYPLHDITRFTQLDYPGKLACIAWFAGCNYRCGFCYNPAVVFSNGRIAVDELLTFLKSRINKLDGVVLSGGEPTCYKELFELCQAIKEMGFLIKLDTNGSLPEVLITLINNQLVDQIALDYKAPQTKFTVVAGVDEWAGFSESLGYVIESDIPHEIRTTVHTSVVDERDVCLIVDDLCNRHYQGIYYLQNYFRDQKTIANLPNQKRILDTDSVMNYAAGKLQLKLRNFI